MAKAMTGRERLTAVLSGEIPDRIPSTFLCNEYYTNHNPGSGTPIEFMKSVGADIMDREYELPFRTTYSGGVEFHQYFENGKTYRVFTTPIGKIFEEYIGAWGRELPFRQKSWIKDIEDYKVLKYVFEHTHFEPNYDWWDERDRYIGDDGIIVPLITDFRSSLEYLMENDQMQTTMDMADEPELLEEVLSVIRQKNIEACKIAAKCPAKFLNIWEDSSTTILSPKLYEKYVLPEMKEFTDILAEEGKKLIQHACGHIKHLMPLMAKEDVVAIESITPLHTGNIVMQDTFDTWGDKFVVIGGIDPAFFVQCTMEQLEEYVVNMIDGFGEYKRKFILQNSDSLPPGVSRTKVEKVVEIAKRYTF